MRRTATPAPTESEDTDHTRSSAHLASSPTLAEISSESPPRVSSPVRHTKAPSLNGSSGIFISVPKDDRSDGKKDVRLRMVVGWIGGFARRFMSGPRLLLTFIVLASIFWFVGSGMMGGWRRSAPRTIRIGASGKPFHPTLTTPYCTAPAAPHLPLVQYVLMVDAGSTGSRIHVYRFNFCNLDPKLEEELFLHVEPGLSAYPDDPRRAARSLDELFEAALDVVPREIAGCTPVAVKATAGLRKLGQEKSEAILREVRKRIEDKYPFRVLEGDEGVEVMDGKDEGVFAWVTVNYLLKRIGAEASGQQSVAIMDLGGGSTQIVFEPNPSFPDTHPAANDHRAEIVFGGKRYELYQHSYLGYGLMEARAKIAKESAALQSGCLPSHFFDDLELPEKRQGATTDDTTLALSDFDKCLLRTTEHSGLFDTSRACPVPPCSFDGVYMPRIRDSFPGEVVAISFFYDRFEKLGLSERVTVADIELWSREVCGYDEEAEHRGASGVDAASSQASSHQDLVPIRALAQKNPHFCLDMTYMYALLHRGYDVPRDRTIRVIKKVDGVEMGWCLGASLEIVDAMWSGVGDGKGQGGGRHRWIGQQCGFER